MIFGTNAEVLEEQMTLTLEIKLPEGLLSSERFDQLLEKYIPNIASEARDFWISEAGRRLKSSKKRYQEGIQLEGSSSKSFSISLNDPLAVAIESGAPGFDLRPGRLGKTIPMNLKKQEVVTSPTYRTVTPFSGKWQHPGWEGKHILDDVVEEIMEKIVPKYVQRIVEEL